VASDALVSREAVRRLLRPRSVAVVGVSEDPGSMGGRALANLELFGIKDVHLVSRTNAAVHGRPCVRSIDELPDGVDAAIIALPRQGVVAAIEACARKKIGGAVLFAAGFGEAGEAGKAEQARIVAVAREADIAVLGPNTLGMTNYVDGVPLAFGPNAPDAPRGRPALAILAQSGAMMGSLRLSAGVRKYAVSYAIATGNEATAGVEDFLEHIVDDRHTTAIALFAEQIRRPADFLRLVAEARRHGKPVVLLHPGRSQRAQASAASHTGALSGDYEVMRTLVAAEGVVAVETLEEFMDAAEFLTRFPDPPIFGPAIVTDSGAIRGLSLDFAEAHNLEIPQLSETTQQQLAARMPEFAEVSNPLDITAQGLKDMALYTNAVSALAADANCGGVLIAAMPGAPDVGLAKADAMLPALAQSGKPRAYVVLGDAPIAPQLQGRVYEQGTPFFRSPERALRTFAHAGASARLRAAAALVRSDAVPQVPLKMHGTLAEYRGKELLKAAGLAIPVGGLAADADTAIALARDIGWPVVLKIQSADLPHKTEVGGVRVGLANEAALRSAWAEMMTKVKELRPEASIEGCLVEAMAPSGLEMVVGGRRDPQWGPVVLFGLGGVWIEALKDVRLIPADLPLSLVRDEIAQLKGRKLLDGFRGARPVEKNELAKVICAVGALLRRYPEIREIDINPLIVYPSGAPLALDALVITE
jgi:acetate---CoA ligase (ADP-forming)